MNVLLVSQCSKRALTETRRILDQFAERRGDRTWQTSITQAGLDTVRKLLRQTARKNTAIACHWLRGRDHSELLWIVGDGRQFNEEGAVPTNTTERNILRAGDENAWHQLPLITALTALAALMHDLGKATASFQEKLRQPHMRERNHYRHEWVSVRLLQAFVGQDNDEGWLQRLAKCADNDVDAQCFEEQWLSKERLVCDGLSDRQWTPTQTAAANPFVCLPPLAQAVAWLVLTHHRLPCLPNRAEARTQVDDLDVDIRTYKRFGSRPKDVSRGLLNDLIQRVNADWNEPRETVDALKLAAHWRFAHGLPVSQTTWRKQAARYANKLLALAPTTSRAAALHDPFTMHLSRMCLMLADHHYSSIEDVARRAPYRDDGYPLYANTRKSRVHDGPSNRHRMPIFNQTLHEHLLGVQAHASLIVHSLPSLACSLPTLQNHRGLKKRNTNQRFQWQDKATDLAVSVRRKAASQGAFIVNMASTGCGKTLGNARIMNALADPKLGMRCSFAIGLRTLTLQTGRSFQNDLGLHEEQLAIRVGGAASRALFDYWERQAEATGSASTQALLDEGGHVLYEGNDRHPILERLTDDAQVRSLIAAPLLVCTVDHLTPATESLRGGRQIAPMLRLLTSDLVLDEPDDFDMADLPALTRLVHWAGLLGSRVLLSSATLPPALVIGLFGAYRAGREVFQKHRSERPHEPINICCMWVDEFQQSAHDCADVSEFRRSHQAFADQRVAQLAKLAPRRLAQIVPLPEALSAIGIDAAQRRKDLAHFMLQRAWGLHQIAQNHSVDPVSSKRVSFGLIRMANIAPLFDVALAMYTGGAPASGVRIHLCVYHSQYPLLTRSVIEHQLDTVLNRRGADDGVDPVFQRSNIRSLIDAHPEQDQLFIVLGSPVTEVGRDHDYDWAVVEPSSMRSLIQLAGRVRRHRTAGVKVTNVEVLDTNLRAIEKPGKAAYCMPGFEMNQVAATNSDAAVHFHFESHSLRKLLSRQLKEWNGPQWPIDARPRIARTEGTLRPSRNWVDLEHARMRDSMLPREADSTITTEIQRDASLAWYETDGEPPRNLWLTGVLPQYQRFREDTQPRVDVVLLPDDDEKTMQLYRVADGKQSGEKLYVCIDESMLQTIPTEKLCPHPRHSVQPWMQVDLLGELRALAEAKDLSLHDCAERYATASLPDKEKGWLWHEALGFTKA